MVKIISLVLLLSCFAAQASSNSFHLYFSSDSNISKKVQARFFDLLKKIKNVKIKKSYIKSCPSKVTCLNIKVGDSEALKLISNNEISSLSSEAFIIKSRAQKNIYQIEIAGKKLNYKPSRYSKGNIGAHFGLYHLLEKMGFGFYHPLEPTLPTTLNKPDSTWKTTQAPRWPVRGIHLHTQHPLELTNLLNGWGPKGIDDKRGFNKMLKKWDLYLEWLIANKQNTTQWALLESEKWIRFSTSTTRQNRLKELTKMGHAWGLKIGVDTPIIFEQQHAFRLIKKVGNFAAEKKEMKKRIDWVMEAGFDFLHTETGKSEFTHPSPKKMLNWMNEFSRHLKEKWNATGHIKIHVGQGQKAKGFKDPQTGKTLNFNYLPYYADRNLGVLPHTVQMYRIHDPAPTYGNKDFSDILRYLTMEAGRREVIWYPESSYWVSHDIDVPLFLPTYAMNRLSDLRLLAKREDQRLLGFGKYRGSKIQGQILFSSGWEWGYWFNDLVAARAAWNPYPKLSEAAAFKKILGTIEKNLQTEGKLTEILSSLVKKQRQYLIKTKNEKIHKRTGQAYIQGFESLDDLAFLVSRWLKQHKGRTQPERLGMVDMASWTYQGLGVKYKKEIRPLLKTVYQFHQKASEQLQVLADNKNSPLLNEFYDSAKMTALRSEQIMSLYEFVYARKRKKGDPKVYFRRAQEALNRAKGIVRRREESYRVPVELIASWKENPTAYSFSYLWTVHSLYYWYRDEGKALHRPKSPCYLGIISLKELASSSGKDLPILGGKVKKILGLLGLKNTVENCINPDLRKAPDLESLVR